MHKKLNKYFLLTLLILIIVPFFPDFQMGSYNSNRKNEIFNHKSIKSAGSSNPPIFIDDSDPNNNWSKTADENDWCFGSGTWIDPYVIKDLVINGNNVSSCIEVRNSNVYFKIENCILYNCSSGNSGIYLYNANNSIILKNNCSNNLGSGIGISNSSNNTIMGNLAINNTSVGIGVWWGTNNTISNNTCANNYRGIFTYGAEYNAIERNIIYGNSVSSINSAGIYLLESNRISIINNTIFENNHGIYLIFDCTNNIIEGNNISSNIQNGIYREGTVNYNKYIKNTISYNGYTGIQLSTGDICWNNTINSCLGGINVQGGSNASIMYNKIINCSGIGIASGYNITISDNELVNSIISFQSIQTNYDQIPTTNITKSNLVNGKPVYFYKNELGLKTSNFSNPGQIILFNCNNSFLSNLVLEGGITLLYCYSILISENTFQSPTSGLTLQFCDNCSISHNNIFDTTQAMYLRVLTNCNITENQIYNNSYGIWLMNSLNIIFNNNNFTNNYVGIWLLNSNENYLNRNFYSKNIVGIYVYTSHNNTIDYNYASNSEWHGMWLLGSSDNNLSSNSIYKNNITGVAVTVNSNNNLFFNNTFIGNTLNAEDNGTANQWDNGIIGNFWDDYTGIDGDDNNIGDTPYSISGLAGSQDNHPIFSASIPPPLITIQSPIEYSLFGSTAPIINIYEESTFTDTIWYFLDDGTTMTNNFTFSGTIDHWDLVGNGTVRIRFYINDSLGQIAFDEIFLRKDIIAPQITINSPTTLSIFEETPPTFNLSILEGNLDRIWYSLDGGITNYQCGITGQINQALWDSLPDGTITIRFYANDTLGNVDFVDVSVNKGTSPSSTIPGYSIAFLLGFISVTMFFMLKRLKKK